MRKQVFGFFTALILAVGIAAFVPHVRAQQTGDRAPAQNPQQGQQPGQQPSQQPAQPGQQPAQQPDQAGQQAPPPAAGQPQGAQVFTGQIVKVGDKFMLKDSSTGATYDVDHQEEVSKFEGRTVRVNGVLDPTAKIIHLQKQ